jgi:uncharacterized iron-regulated protein
MEKAVKKSQNAGLSQFLLSKKILNILSQFSITPTAKLVLLYLIDCYNQKRATVFPKQKTIATRLGVSERSVVRAIAELANEGLILVECTNSNKYRFTSRVISDHAEVQNDDLSKSDKKSDNKRQIDSLKTDKMSPHDMNIKENYKKNISKNDYEILEEYAEKRGVNNKKAYINALIKNNAVQSIVAQYNEEKMAVQRAKALKTLTKREIKKNEKIKTYLDAPADAWLEFGKKFNIR